MWARRGTSWPRRRTSAVLAKNKLCWPAAARTQVSDTISGNPIPASVFLIGSPRSQRRRRDRPRRRRPNFKTAALNHSAILPALWKYSCFPRTRMLDKWFCQRFAGEQPEPSSSAPLYGGAHRRVNLRRCVPPASPVRLSGVVYLSLASSSFCPMTRRVSRNGSRQRLTPFFGKSYGRRDSNCPERGGCRRLHQSALRLCRRDETREQGVRLERA